MTQISRISWWLLIVVVFAGLVLALNSCAGVNALEAYRTDLHSCIANAKTKAEADACRAAVDMHYCNPYGSLGDAGGCEIEGGK